MKTKTATTTKVIGARTLNHLTGKMFYVSCLPRRRRGGSPVPGYADFGYTDRIEGYPYQGDPTQMLDAAIHLTPYWQCRFLALRHDAPKDSIHLIRV